MELQSNKQLLQNKKNLSIVYPAHGVALAEGQISNRDLTESSDTSDQSQ